MFKAAMLFILAGLAEIGGGYLVWLALREQKGWFYGIAGATILILYGILPTLQEFPSFGRVYAAYGGVFIALSLLWGWGIDGRQPDFWDGLGAAIALLGAGIILYAPRG
ncbi:MAG: YnfA family protein [Bacillota bacterium]|uniref:Small multidrug resistance family-3 protein n=2 Tax=Carboxydocella TaxID=178898 RepID=A0A1T4R5J7_9FIRM|nr:MULTISPECIES: YnfA family protein [Carboxydocella]AVX19387.1 small multidrug resistance family-3 protein [Carboxydocella thermautotrophica]AVX29801.1 small multidrug resistance family-3 protein [Carboxydocella thermautotrophica]SKA11334.1 small multidrug resistance family-3 protein [Carboxydocella sporoproducens DSM 16521]GAW29128.1 protein of unknown function UPF0060 [Carboxydocella sp. ULO1]GAW32006.1 protein of unknown function UPF0060 [Carboxydocella sp. JDF658]